ncbi:hypothetical protein SBOR_6118 [Sclerotinia borealis F-4128]|uniref:Uncharacterized protein n=1 Tax=Sclerotinia borealis (strain F-4128) TaxID=1432307 RepID=W9CG21_SCLBF|nr:hypothetical protein SBOR_6118 [Sclerotinia borealis F-4128]
MSLERMDAIFGEVDAVAAGEIETMSSAEKEKEKIEDRESIVGDEKATMVVVGVWLNVVVRIRGDLWRLDDLG